MPLTELLQFADKASKEAADLERRLAYCHGSLAQSIRTEASRWRHIEADARNAAETGCEASLESVQSFVADHADEWNEDWDDLLIARPAESYVPGFAA